MEVSGPEPIAGTPAVHDAHAYINDETFAVAIQTLANLYQAIYEKGTKWTPPDAQAGTPAEADDSAEKYDICLLRAAALQRSAAL
eukprot:4153504-Pyramimonas_sp.AAC.1